ncbi:MAG: hypothetical protein CMM15_04465 [Rhodospirillaceae bacterium]|nr:hypothetical protein [Rhodospirillaceae bacterium]OUU27353.1 MAG: hypothetical protein CBB97_06165 [Candidatus Endolissoclinum sp. TMED37]
MEVTIYEALNKAINAQKNGRALEAEKIYFDILFNVPSYPDALHNLGVMALGTRNGKRALVYFKRAIASNPNVKQFWLSYLNTLIKLEKLEEAKQAYKQAEKIGATNDPFVKIRSVLKPIGKEHTATPKAIVDFGALSTKEVAAEAKVHKDTLLRWLRNGSIPEPKRDHRGWRKFSHAEVTAIIKFSQTGSLETNISTDRKTKREENWISL